MRWQDIDYDEGFVRIRQQLGRDRLPAKLKTDRSRRDIVLIPELAKVLKAHWLASPHKQASDYVFPAPTGKGRDHRSTSKALERATTRANIEGISFHSLRHGFASVLICGLKYDVETVSRQLGHKNSQVTLTVYSHEFEKARNSDDLRDRYSETYGKLLSASS